MGRRLGQHFLQSHTVLGKILAAAAVVPGEAVLEVGPGRGILSEGLLAAGARLTAVEVDPALCAALRQRWGAHEAFRLVEGDILAADLAPEALFGPEAPPARYALVANLPYYLSTPFFFRVIAHRAYVARMVLMVQKEIADRLVALPEAGKVYGSLSVVAHHAFAMEPLFAVPPGAFHPPPKVHSAVVALTPRPPVLGPAAEKAFLAHVKELFTTRRKLMLTGLRRRHPQLNAAQGERLAALVGQRRAEALSPAEHLEVFRLLQGPGPEGGAEPPGNP
ncbi:MAG: 16S rRNA (adenine(1518)-N(6)/adenine(1519)-N(6))-dimethyltransferase RsmA [bacterium]